MKKDLTPLSSRFEVTRRTWLELVAAGIGALSAGCLEQAGEQQIVPYVADPPEQRPGKTVRYAGATSLDGFGLGTLIETHEGRPTKLDGNPAHPATLGGSTPWLQARILDLYDPQRSNEPHLGEGVTSWAHLQGQLHALPAGPLWLVMPPQSSPTAAWLLSQIAAQHDLHVVYDAPLPRTNIYRGHALVYGRPVEHLPDLARADVIAALDADFMAHGPMAPALARVTAARRDPHGAMNRLWVCEPVQTPTGTLADETLAVPAGDVPAVIACIAEQLATRGVAVPKLPARVLELAHGRLGAHVAWARRLADDLYAHRGAGCLLIGERQPPAVHALARILDHALANPGKLVPPALLEPIPARALADLVAAKPAAVIVIDCDPVFTAPHLPIEATLRGATYSLHVGSYLNDTARACHAHMPLAHELETWTDPRAVDGTLAIGQPALRPRFEVASLLDVLEAILGGGRDSRTLVYDQLRGQLAPRDLLGTWDWSPILRKGVVDGTASPALDLAPTWRSDDDLAKLLAPRTGIEIALAPSPAIHDGRFATNAWLQELPHPITKQTWGNAALMSTATAHQLGVANDALVKLATARGDITVPTVIVTGAADGSITVELGYGQRAAGMPIARGLGANAYVLRDDALVIAGTATRVPGTGPVLRTQHFTSEEGRSVAPSTRLAQYRLLPNFTEGLRGDQPSLLPPQNEDGVQWAMMIDTGACTGCSACMIACQAENNVPSVGPAGVEHGRQMHWLRIDRYVHDDGEVVNEPMLCQHCEDAPCEYVCPVNAATHSHDGLNEQIYNRCVGTRFCSNNCPYKVRRFNWFAYEREDSAALQYNPDVTVRSRGVMEKCTYCVQRIRGAEHTALVEKRAIKTGEVVTACQAACPTAAIQLGMLGERGTRFAEMRAEPRRFEVLHDLGTRPRTQYLAKIKNPKERP